MHNHYIIYCNQHVPHCNHYIIYCNQIITQCYYFVTDCNVSCCNMVEAMRFREPVTELLTVYSVVLTVAGGSPTVHSGAVNLSGGPQTNHC